MDEDLDKFLKALESAPDHPIPGYLELDGFSNAFDYLTRAEKFLRNSDDPFQFKWVTICLSNALYGFMICVLGEGNPDNVTAWPPELERELRGLAKVVSNEALLARLRLRNEYRQYNRTKQIGFGPWHQVYQAEFDGMRKKRVIVKIIGG